MPGRTRWVLYVPVAQALYVNIADPAQIVVVDGRRADRIARTFPIPSAGPHGLDLDLSTHRLICACDSATLVTLDTRSGQMLGQDPLSGAPDVGLFDRLHGRLYIAVGDPGTIDVFDAKAMECSERRDRGGRAHVCARTPGRATLCVSRQPSRRNLPDRWSLKVTSA